MTRIRTTCPRPNVAVWNTPEGLKDFPTPQQWGMSIDLNTCLGCTACLVACQAENNIPIVGKDQVMRGREMHWIRLDRYFASGPVKGRMARSSRHRRAAGRPAGQFPKRRLPALRIRAVRKRLPLHGHAARRLGPERHGLQPLRRHEVLREQLPLQSPPLQLLRLEQARDRRILRRPPRPGLITTPTPASSTRMQKNPDVSIRMRGVMEKCTYCVQRIEAAKITARVKARDSGDTKVAGRRPRAGLRRRSARRTRLFSATFPTRAARFRWPRPPTATTRCWAT